MRIYRYSPLVLALICLMSCAPPETSDPWFMKLPVYHDPRPQHVLFSWEEASYRSFRFALVHDPTLGGGRNDFIDRFNDRRTKPLGLDLAALEEAISKLPETSVIEWWFEEKYRFTLPPAGIIQRIKWLAARRHFHLHFTNANQADA